MPVTVAQFGVINGAWSGSMGQNAQPGSTLYLFPFCYNGSAMASSNPQFAGSPVPGAAAFAPGQNAGGGLVYGACWQLPDIAGGSELVSVTNSGNGIVDANVGLGYIEAQGLGIAPVLDPVAPNPVPGSGSTGAITAGPVGPVTDSPDLILAFGIAFGQNVAGPGGAWTSKTPSSFSIVGYQVAAASGGAYTYPVGSAATAGWYAAVLAVAVTPAPPPSGLPVVPPVDYERGALLRKPFLW
jgi:hypothetical protein